MGLTVITPPAVEPVTLAEARTQCNVDGTDHDAVLALCIAGARAKCEGLIQKALITRTLEQTLDAFPPLLEMKLQAVPALAVLGITYIDTAGNPQTLAPTAYTLDATRQATPWVLPAYGTEWPATQGVINAVRVRYQAGFGSSAASVPDDLRHWIRMTAGFLFTHREAFDVTGRVAAIPSRFMDSLLDPWRDYGF